MTPLSLANEIAGTGAGRFHISGAAVCECKTMVDVARARCAIISEKLALSLLLAPARLASEASCTQAAVARTVARCDITSSTARGVLRAQRDGL